MTPMPIDRVLPLLRNVKETGPDKCISDCPACGDTKRHLSTTVNDKGDVLVNCFKGCTFAEIAAALGIPKSDFFTGDKIAGAPRPAGGNGKGHTAPKVYTTLEDGFASAVRFFGGKFLESYKYPDGFTAIRIELPEVDAKSAKHDKKVLPFRTVAGGYEMKDPQGLLPIYHRDELPKEGTIDVFEGERKTDLARTYGYAATTSAHGAGAAKKTDWTPLAHRNVVIFPDNNAAGMEYAETVAGILTALGCTVRIVPLPGLKDGEDFEEWVAADGPADCKDADEIRAWIADLTAAAPIWSPPATATAEPATKDKQAKTVGATPVLTRLQDVKPRKVEWLHYKRIPLGKVTVIAGDPGLGKSFISIDYAARVSRGTPFSDCPDRENPAGGVVMLTAEDDLEDTVRPRLDAAQADVSRIIAIEAVNHYEADSRQNHQALFSLEHDLPALEKAIEAVGDCRLVVIDPFTAYLGATDSHKNAEMRALLAPLAKLAAKYRVAVIGISHLRKGEGPAMYRTMGSMAFVAAARAAYVVCKDKLDITGRRRFVLPIKNNCGDDETGMAYRLDATFTTNGQPVVRWEPDPIKISADEALKPVPQKHEPGDDSDLGEAERWLTDALRDGPVAATEIQKLAKADGIAPQTLRRAKESLKIESGKEQGIQFGAWEWRLPAGANIKAFNQDGQASTLGNVDHLEHLDEIPGETICV